MPLFSRSSQANERETGGTTVQQPGLVSEREIIAMLANEIERARRYERPLSVVYLAPQTLPGERTYAAELDLVSNAIAMLLRSVDRVALLAEGSYLVVLPETSADQAQVVAQRLQIELTLRSASLNQRKWLAGAGGYPGGGESPEALIETASRAIHR